MRLAKAVLLCVVFASGLDSPAADEPIELTAVSPKQIEVIEGRSATFEARLVSGTGVGFQWFHTVQSGVAQWVSQPVSGATDPRLHFDFPESYDFGEYVLKATNSVDSASLSFNLWVDFAPHFFEGLEGYQGLKGDSFRIDLEPNVLVNNLEWFHDGKPVPGPIAATLTEEAEGEYWFQTRASSGEILTSPHARVRIKPATEAGAKYRLILDYRSAIFNGDDPYLGNIVALDSSALVFTMKNIYRWNKGVFEKNFDTGPNLLGYGTNWTIWSGTAEDANSVEYLVNEKVDGTNRATMIHKDVGGVKMIAETGMLIANDPALAVTEMGQPIRSNGKTAFWAQQPPDGAGHGGFAIEVYDGQNLSEWFNTKTGWPPEFAGWVRNFTPDTILGFDGETAAFVAYAPVTRDVGLFTVNSAHEIKAIALRKQKLGARTFGGFHGARVTVRNGKVLFLADFMEDFTSFGLVEYDPSRADHIRLLAMEGESVGGECSLSRIFPMFHYAGDGSVLFSAMAGSYTTDRPINGKSTFPLHAIFRWRDGVLTKEVDGRQRLGGVEMQYLFLNSAAGSNFVFGANGGYYTTAEGSPRPTNSQAQIQSQAVGFNFDWNGEGRLQTSDDMIHWNYVQGPAQGVTNDSSKRAKFFRVFYP